MKITIDIDKQTIMDLEAAYRKKEYLLSFGMDLDNTEHVVAGMVLEPVYKMLRKPETEKKA